MIVCIYPGWYPLRDHEKGPLQSAVSINKDSAPDLHDVDKIDERVTQQKVRQFTESQEEEEDCPETQEKVWQLIGKMY